MHVRVCWAILSTVLMDRKDALGSPSCAAESLVHGIAQDALREMPVEPLEALRRRIVHGHDEAEVSRIPQTPAVLTERPPDRRFAAPEGAVSLTDPV